MTESPTAPAAAAAAAELAADAPVPPMQGALQITTALAYAGFTLDPVAGAVVSGEVYPALTALQLGTVLLDPAAYPTTDRPAMSAALTGTGRYTQAQVQAALDTLYGGTRRLGPFGGGSSYYQPPVPFDDLAFATETDYPITGLRSRGYGVLDAIQAVYGARNGPYHGSPDGGDPKDVQVPPNDLLQGVSGYVGARWGAVYVLQLTFVTRSERRLEWLGTKQLYPTDQQFDMRAGAGEQIVALYGQTAMALRYNQQPTPWVNQIGVYVRPW